MTERAYIERETRDAETYWLGRDLCQQRWRDYPAFVARIGALDGDALAAHAAAYIAYIRTYAIDTTLTVAQVVTTWMRMRTD